MKTLNDLTVPRQPVRKLLEKDVQKQCVDWARARGYWARKFSSMTQNSVPDYLFSRQRKFLIDGMDSLYVTCHFGAEFKRPGGKSTDAQLDEQQAMRDAGWFVFECDDLEKFKKTVLDYENEVFPK